MQLLTTCADFWGPASNFGIPIAAIADMSKDPEMYVYALQHPETLTLAPSILPHSFRPHTSSISPSSVS